MDRNLDDNGGLGKYAIINLRRLEAFRNGTFGDLEPGVANALKLLESRGILEWGRVGTEHEFFLIKLKDRNSLAALSGYCNSIFDRDPEFATEILEMMTRAGPASKWCKDPD